jgi:hypothetical protein
VQFRQFLLVVVRGLRWVRLGVSRAMSCRLGSRSECTWVRIWLGLACAMRGTALCCAGCSCSASCQDAVDCFDWVAFLSGLAGHEPAFVCLGPAELAGACVVGVYPSAIADDVAAVAARLATVCVDFYWCVHVRFP